MSKPTSKAAIASYMCTVAKLQSVNVCDYCKTREKLLRIIKELLRNDLKKDIKNLANKTILRNKKYLRDWRESCFELKGVI